jgi:hypothetical protein
MIERVSITQWCVDAALLLSLLWRNCWRRYEQIHLVPSLPFFMNAEDYRQRMA